MGLLNNERGIVKANSRFENIPESKSFLSTALAIHGSVTPRVIPRVLAAAVYALFVYGLGQFIPHAILPMTPFEYSGAVLALILVLRVNAGHDRWWEARKIWGSIVNQSRNLAISSYAYGYDSHRSIAKELVAWVAAWPYVMKDSLRKSTSLDKIDALLGRPETDRIRKAQHMPTYVGFRIAAFLNELKSSGMSPLAFHRCESERSALIDAIGACERIRNTRMPYVLAIKSRRFILLFLLLMPLALIDRAGLWTPLVVALAAYPMFSLDEIGAELQNPFSLNNLSHLPLDGICDNIAANVLALKTDYQFVLDGGDEDQTLMEKLSQVGAVREVPIDLVSK
jgi:ion channel-forming bestrophin family protein